MIALLFLLLLVPSAWALEPMTPDYLEWINKQNHGKCPSSMPAGTTCYVYQDLVYGLKWAPVPREGRDVCVRFKAGYASGQQEDCVSADAALQKLEGCYIKMGAAMRAMEPYCCLDIQERKDKLSLDGFAKAWGLWVTARECWRQP